MSRLDDLFGDSQEETQEDDFGIEVDASIQCVICNASADQAFYNKQKKKIKIICNAEEEPHIAIADLDLSFIYG